MEALKHSSEPSRFASNPQRVQTPRYISSLHLSMYTYIHIYIDLLAFHCTSQTSCLGYLDESLNPPRWICQDSCLSYNSNGNLCGTTNHLTNFAILFFGGQSACSSDFIFGIYQKDLALIGSVAAFILLLCLLLLLLSYLPCSKRIIYSKEAQRVRSARFSMIKARETYDETIS